MDETTVRARRALAAFVVAARKVARSQADVEEARARRVVALERALTAGLSTEELAVAVGVEAGTIRQWRLRGKNREASE